jgi:hypothetical protein
MVMQIAWLDAIFEVPDNWEVTRYSIASPVGRIEFAGREGTFGVYSWETCKQRIPDEKRILTEYHRNYLKEFDKEEFQKFSGFETERIGQFHVGIPGDGHPLYAVTHLLEQKKMFLWSFPCFSKEKMKNIWRPLLESFKPNDGDFRKWSMFGIHAALPSDFELDETCCKPADTWMGLERKNLHKVFLHRWGVPRELIIDNDMEDFFKYVLRGHEGRLLTSTKEDFRGMESLKITCEIRGTKGMDKLYASRWKGTGRLWHNKDEKRLYAWIQCGPKKVELIDEKVLIPE